MSKRQKFTLLSILLPLAVSTLPVLEQPYLRWGSAVLAVFTAFLASWVLRTSSPELFIPPAILIGYGSIIYSILPPTPVVSGLFIFILAVIHYLLLLSANVFLISRERLIPLLSAAQSVFFVLTVLVYLISITVVYKLDFSLLLQLVQYLVLTFALSWCFIQAVFIDKEAIEHLLTPATLILTYAGFQTALGLSLFPLTALRRSVILTTAFYSFLGIAQHYLQRKLYKNVLWEYLLTAVVVGAVFAVAELGGFPLF